MTPERTKALLPLITAFANGEKIQFRQHTDDDWFVQNGPTFAYPPECYRIAPKPPEEPNYGQVLYDAWMAGAVALPVDVWNVGAKATIEAYKAHQKALEEFNKA